MAERHKDPQRCACPRLLLPLSAGEGGPFGFSGGVLLGFRLAPAMGPGSRSHPAHGDTLPLRLPGATKSVISIPAQCGITNFSFVIATASAHWPTAARPAERVQHWLLGLVGPVPTPPRARAGTGASAVGAFPVSHFTATFQVLAFTPAPGVPRMMAAYSLLFPGLGPAAHADRSAGIGGEQERGRREEPHTPPPGRQVRSLRGRQRSSDRREPLEQKIHDLALRIARWREQHAARSSPAAREAPSARMMEGSRRGCHTARLVPCAFDPANAVLRTQALWFRGQTHCPTVREASNCRWHRLHNAPFQDHDTDLMCG